MQKSSIPGFNHSSNILRLWLELKQDWLPSVPVYYRLICFFQSSNQYKWLPLHFSTGLSHVPCPSHYYYFLSYVLTSSIFFFFLYLQRACQSTKYLTYRISWVSQQISEAGGWNKFPFTGKKTEAQKVPVTCSRSHRNNVEGMAL